MKNKVLLGKNGRLFLDNDSNCVNNQHEGKLLLSNQQIEDWNELLSFRFNKLAKEGVAYLHFVSPDAQSIYPEDLPYELASVRPIVQLEQSGLADKIFFLYPVAELKKAKVSGNIIYPKNDTHWSPYGALLGSLEIFKRLKKFDVDIESSILEKIEVERKTFIGDLGNKLNPNVEALVDTVNLSNQKSHLSFHNGIEVSGKFQVFSNENQSLPTVIIFGTSFTYGMLKVLKEGFGTLIFCHSTSVDYKLVSKIKPNVVITEIPERFMVAPPADNKPYLRTDLVKNKLSALSSDDIKIINDKLFNYRNINIPNSVRLSFAKAIFPFLDCDDISFGDYALLRRKNTANKLLIAFSGGGTSRKSFNYYKQLSDREESVLFLNTIPELYYHSGVPGLGESEGDMLQTLRYILTCTDTSAGIFTFGVSQGGWGALAIGTRLNAKRILALGTRHPIFTPLHFGCKYRSALIDASKSVTDDIFSSDIGKILFYGDASWHDLKSFNYYKKLKNCQMKMYGNLPHNLAIHLANYSKFSDVIESFIGGEEVDLLIPETEVFLVEEIVDAIYKAVYSESPSLDHVAVYNAIQGEGLPSGQFELARIREALAELHLKLGDKKSAVGNYMHSIDSCITLPSISGLISMHFDTENYDDVVILFEKYYESINYKDQERDSVGEIFYMYLFSIHKKYGLSLLRVRSAGLKKICSWAFQYPKLCEFLLIKN